mgnify:CR=1 FL=1
MQTRKVTKENSVQKKKTAKVTLFKLGAIFPSLSLDLRTFLRIAYDHAIFQHHIPKAMHEAQVI